MLLFLIYIVSSCSSSSINHYCILLSSFLYFSPSIMLYPLIIFSISLLTIHFLLSNFDAIYLSDSHAWIGSCTCLAPLSWNVLVLYSIGEPAQCNSVHQAKNQYHMRRRYDENARRRNYASITASTPPHLPTQSHRFT